MQHYFYSLTDFVVMCAKKTNDISNYFKVSNDDPVQTYINDRLAEENAQSETGNVEYVDVDVENVDFYKEKVVDLEIENEKLKTENLKLKKDNQDLKKLFNKSNQVNLQKDLLIAQLKQQIDENSSNSASNISSSSQKNRQKILFTQFEDKIDIAELVKLRSINDKREKDCTFVLQCLRILYKNNERLLCERTAAKNTSSKRELSPEKKSVISELFYERLSAINLNPNEEQERRSKLRSLIASGIHNIANSIKQKSAASGQ